MKKKGLFAIVVCFLTLLIAAPALSDAGDTEKKMAVEQCKALVQDFFSSMLARDWELLQPTEINIKEKVDKPGTLVVEAKTLPFAYLIGCTPASCVHPKRFITPAVENLFSKMPLEHIADIPCPNSMVPAELNAFREHIMMTFANLFRYIALYKQTSYIQSFFSQFDKFFKERWLIEQEKLVKGIELLKWDAEAFDIFLDETYTTLKVTVYFYGVVWDGHGGTYDDVMAELAKGIRDTPAEFSFTIDVSPSRGKEETDKELTDRASEAADRMVSFSKAVWLYGPARPL